MTDEPWRAASSRSGRASGRSSPTAGPSASTRAAKSHAPEVGVARKRAGRAGQFAGSVMRVETLGQISRRVTTTRLVMLGVFAFAVKKKQEDREPHITIEGEGFRIAVPAYAKKSVEARSFAARYNTLAALGVASPEPAASAQTPPSPARADLPGQLHQLAQLHAQGGALTDAEFRAAKSRLRGDEPGAQDQQPRAW